MACCHRRGSVHDLSIGGSVCHDRGLDWAQGITVY